MKNLVLAIIGLVGIGVLSSCSGYDMEDILDVPPYEPKDTTNNNPNTPNDDEWETVMDDWYNIINNHTTIDSHKKTSKTEYIVNAPFSVSLGKHIYFTTEDKNESSFVTIHSIDPRNISYGDWYVNEEDDSIRSTTSTQVYECNLYNRNLVINNAEAFRFINGTRDPFEMPKIIVSFAGHQSDFETKEIERNDSIFSRENIKDSVKVSFGNRPDIASYYVSATATIDHFLRLVEKKEEMPTPTFWVEGEILYISNRTASPIYTTADKKQANWYEVCDVKTTKKTYVVVNGQKNSEWNNEELADATWGSALYDVGYTNKWVPANINNVTSTGWTYTAQFSNGSFRVLEAPMNVALISALKSFSKDDNATQTPFLSTAAAVKGDYSNGTLYTVNGIYSFTVASSGN